MGLDHIRELMSGRRSSRLLLVVYDLDSDLVSDLVTGLVSGLEVPVVSVVGLTGPNFCIG